MYTVANLAWAAGFIDGEGCIGIYTIRGKLSQLQYRLTVGNLDRAPLEKLQQMFGGSIQLHSREHTKNCRPCFHWTACSCHAELALKAVLPYLIVKKAQAELFLSARATDGNFDRAAVLAQFRALNKRGRN